MDDQSKNYFLNIGSKIDNLQEVTTDVRLILASQEIITKQHKEVLDKLSFTSINLQAISTQQETNLKLHMHRTTLMEQRLQAFDTEVRPILEGMRFLKRLGTFAAALAGIVAVVLKVIGK